ncbi:MAG: phosphotransferase [Zhongshania sp.]|uniref:phosphotransferase family protein n=1 Tax=Zhongshania sp. TaxID=1971902 RepID=UPI00261F5B02|nr:phosphotransferase [Zhongshania sp.]MDF1692190.1 phosphotransferase [Zhongshania sp.]
MNESISIIPNADGVTADFINAQLNSHGHPVQISAISSEPVGAGQVGDTYRYHLQHESAASEFPRVMIGKHHSANTDSRAVAKQLSLYRNEALFYKHIAPSAGICSPHAYLVMHDDSDRFLMLLEDVSPARVGDQLGLTTEREARMAVLEAAKLHASHWGRNDIVSKGYIQAPDLAQGIGSPAAIQQCWDGFKARFGDIVCAPHLKIVERFVKNNSHWNRPLDRPRCITHNDYRPENMLFSEIENSKHPLYVVDWQTLSFNYGASDVAYFLGGSFEENQLAIMQELLLPEYYDALCSQGVSDYSYAQFYRDYQYFSFAGLTITIIASMSVKRTERGDQLFNKMLSRYCHQIEINDAARFL